MDFDIQPVKRDFRYRVGHFGKLILQVKELDGWWRDAHVEDITVCAAAVTVPQPATEPPREDSPEGKR